jgi:hypothetical protein
MAVFSSGTARAPGDSGYVNPNGQYGSFDQQKSTSYPAGFPKNAAGCPASGSQAYDSTGLKLTIRVPTNARSFSYNFQYFSSEYPEWVCTAYNDHFVALLDSQGYDGNISFDANQNPVSVNVAFFTVPGCTTCTSPVLAGTGFDGTCQNKICGGSTDWLYTTAPVTPGETITLRFATWDQGDHKWDSTVLLDNFRWSGDSATVQTGKQPAAPDPEYSEGWFVRDYSAAGFCAAGTQLTWGLWSWSADTPADTKIEFYLRTATTKAGLDTAVEVPLTFSNPPGPTTLEGQPAVAQAALVPDTQGGSAVVDDTLIAKGLPQTLPWLRVRSRLVPSGDKKSAPVLEAWNQQFRCLPSE